jgi:phage shock protein A
MNNRIAAAEAKIERQEKQVQDCHKEKEQLRVELAAVKTRLEILESRVV